MSFTLRAALGFRSRMGPKAGLAVLRPLVDQLKGEERAEALLGALECARELDDAESYEALVAQWMSVDVTTMFAQLSREVGAARILSPRLALELARTECVRCPEDARAHYLLARVSPPESREASYVQALLLAARPPVRELDVAQIAASMISEGLDPGSSVVASLSSKDVDALSARSQIAIARYRLAHVRGYKRVAALDGLIDHVGDGPVSALALKVVAEFADRQMPTPLEWDRLGTAAHGAGAEAYRRFAMWRALRENKESTSPLAREATLAVSSTTLRAKKTEAGSDEWAWPPAKRGAAQKAYVAILKLRRGEDVDFASFLAHSAGAGAPTLALCALGLSKDAGGAAELAEALAQGAAARRGWLRLAKAAAARGLHSLASRLLERGLACGELGAERALGEDLRRRAWALREGEEALALLSRARRLLRGVS
ncbi:MAG: hypothetical protein AB8H86_05455 [Polyangiales bacterium]